MKKVFLTIILTLTIFTTFSNTISGIILDSKTKEPLIGVTIYVNNKRYYTNLSGEFIIPYHDRISIKYISYNETTIVLCKENNNIVILLNRK